MIYDFGCSGPADALSKIVSAFPGALAVMFVVAGLASIGAVFGRRTTFKPTDIFSGWGLVAAFMTLIAVSFNHAMVYAAFTVMLCLFAALIHAIRQGYFKSPFWLLALFPGLMILLIINLSGVAKWDDFSHWVPNALYLFHFDSVPGRGLPPPHSAWPGYPYAVPMITYLASRIAGGFLVQGGAMFNFMLLLTFVAMLVETTKTSSQLLLMGVAVFVVTLANPAFNASFTITNQGDTATMVLVGALALMLWRMLNALGLKKTQGIITQYALPVMAVSLALLLIKQVNIILLGLLIAGFLVVAWKNKILRPALRQLPLMAVPALVMYGIWQYHVKTELNGNEFGMRPMAEWRFNLIGGIAKAMLMEMLKKNGLFLVSIITVVYGLRGFFRRSASAGDFALLAAIVICGYVGFLFIAYLGATFSENEVLRAASFYRYSTHVGLLGLTFFWMMAPDTLKKFKTKIRLPAVKGAPARYAITLAVLSLLPLATLIHVGWLVPQSSVETCEVRSLGEQVVKALPTSPMRIAIIAPDDQGLMPYLLNFEFALEEARTDREISLAWNINALNIDELPGRLQNLPHGGDADAVLIAKTIKSSANVLGYDSSQGPILLRRQEQQWENNPL